MNPTGQFANQVVFITGGTSGIGLATAIAFSKAGAEHVIVVGRDPSKWKKAQLPIKHVIEYWPCDVRIEREVEEVIKRIFEKYHRLDVCFNNAGVQPVNNGDITQFEFGSFQDRDGSINFYLPGPDDCGPTQTTPISQFCESEIATGVFGVSYCLKHELSYIYRYQPGHLPVSIINTASRMGLLPDAHRPMYSASKAFIISLTRTIATQAAEKVRQMERASIRINAIAPGPIDTPLERAAFPDLSKAAKGVPLGQVGHPLQMASLVLFLADRWQSGYITGTTISADGGFTGSPII